MPWKVDGSHKGKKKEKGGTLSQMIVAQRINVYMSGPLITIVES